jgi:ATP-dependent helicase/DNAse subunit B
MPEELVVEKGLYQLSPSKLAAFVTCPVMFKARYLLGIKTPVSASMVLGRAVHSALEKLGRFRQLELEIGLSELLVEFNEAFKADVEKEGIAIRPDEDSKLRASGEGLVKIYFERFGQDRPIASELHLDETLINPVTGEAYQRPAMSSIEPGDLGLYGIVDSLLDEGDGLVVVDYKTTSRTSADSSIMLTHRMQLLCYAYLMQRASDKPVKALEIRQLVRKKEPDIAVTRVPIPPRLSYAPMFMAVESLLASIQSGAFLARYGWHCHGSCEGYGICSPLG